MNRKVEVLAAFNLVGEVKPVYIRMEDDEHLLHTYKIEHVRNIKKENLLGMESILFVCEILVRDCLVEIKLRHYGSSHKWMRVQ